MAPTVLRAEVLAAKTSDDIVYVRQSIRAVATPLGFTLVDQTKLITAASELTRNMLDYAGGGSVVIEVLADSRHTGIRLTFEDHGPGIPDLSLAMNDGYSTSGGMGFGLGGAKRLVNDFSIESAAGKGTKVIIARWK